MPKNHSRGAHEVLWTSVLSRPKWNVDPAVNILETFSIACDYIFIANEMSVLCEVEKITNAVILKAYVQLAYDDGLIAKSA